MDIPWTKFDPPEAKRTYVFPGGERLELVNVTHLEVRPSGKHRLMTAEGRKLFIAPGWLWIEIDVENWTC